MSKNLKAYKLALSSCKQLDNEITKRTSADAFIETPYVIKETNLVQKYIKYNYVTCATGKKFIQEYTQYAIRSLLRTGASYVDVTCIVNTIADHDLLRKFIKEPICIIIMNYNLSFIKWKAHGGRRKYSVFKAYALHTVFGDKGYSGERLCYFDGDTLFFKDPAPFFDLRNEKTWYHHGKDLETVSIRKSRAGRLMKKHEVDVTKLKSLQKWVSLPCAYSMIKRGATKVPDTEAVAGFWLMHPKDQKKLLKLTYKCCLDIVKGIRDHQDVGDQKSMNAALNILEIDWHGGSRFACPEHEKYFFHFFGVTEMKQDFKNKVKELKL